jgi:hypothetical protein
VDSLFYLDKTPDQLHFHIIMQTKNVEVMIRPSYISPQSEQLSFSTDLRSLAQGEHLATNQYESTDM